MPIPFDDDGDGDDDRILKGHNGIITIIQPSTENAFIASILREIMGKSSIVATSHHHDNK